MGYIYKITNKITKKNYIGQTTQDLNIRWLQHKKSTSNCRYLKSAFNKYGINNFDFQLICIGFDNDMNKLEKFYINKYNSLVPFGYNLRDGGNNGKHNEETKNKISKTLKNKNIVNKSFLGKKHSEVTKNKISTTLTGKKNNKDTIHKKQISLTKNKIYKIDIKTGKILEIFNGYPEAAKCVNTSKGHIWRVCNGKSKTAKGFIWKCELI